MRTEILLLFEVRYREYERAVVVTNVFLEDNPYWWKDYFVNDVKLGLIPREYRRLQEESDVLNFIQTLLQRRILLIQRLRKVISETQGVLQLIKEELGD